MLVRRVLILASAALAIAATPASAELRGATGITYPPSTPESVGVIDYTQGLGDVDANGYGDIGLLAPFTPTDGPYFPDSFAIFGQSAQTNVDLATPPARVKRLPTTMIRKAGDVNGDGKDDVIVSVGPTVNGQIVVYTAVVFGGPGVADVRLDRLGNRGFQILSTDFWQAAGDINGDGKDDLVSVQVDPNPTPEVWEDVSGATVIYGKSTATPVNPANLGAGGVRFSSSVKATVEEKSIASGDLNGDGKGDLALQVGFDRSVVVFGSSAPTPVDLDQIGARGYAISSTSGLQSDTLDFTGDGRADLIATTFGRTAVVPGQSTTSPVTADWTASGSPAIELSDAASLTSSARYPSAVPAGDLNNDGRDDVVITRGGALHVVSGRSAPGQAFAGAQVPGVFGSVLYPAGDVDGDHRADLLAVNLGLMLPAQPGTRGRMTVVTHGRDILAPAWSWQEPSILPSSFKVGQTAEVMATLTEPATLELLVRRSNGTTVGTLKVPVTSQALQFDWDGRVNGKALPVGGYTTTVTPVDAAGNRGTSKVVSFTILP
ncbi:MAG: FG-GAP repeat protein [Solirubrobacteraceae bacterium]|nr:FG-GAP repeat protein [Solirubrobacteraceae bacterium]